MNISLRGKCLPSYSHGIVSIANLLQGYRSPGFRKVAFYAIESGPCTIVTEDRYTLNKEVLPREDAAAYM